MGFLKFQFELSSHYNSLPMAGLCWKKHISKSFTAKDVINLVLLLLPIDRIEMYKRLSGSIFVVQNLKCTKMFCLLFIYFCGYLQFHEVFSVLECLVSVTEGDDKLIKPVLEDSPPNTTSLGLLSSYGFSSSDDEDEEEARESDEKTLENGLLGGCLFFI